MGSTIDGVVSGLSTESLINQMMQVEQQPMRVLQNRQAQINKRLKAFQDLNSRVAALRSSAELAQGGFGEMAVTSSASSVLSATATKEAAAGSYRLDVLQLAQAQKRVAQGVNDATTSTIAKPGGGAFAFHTGPDGETTTVRVAADATLSDLAREINRSGAGVRASVINDGSTYGAYRLVLTATGTGLDGEVHITTNDTVLDFDHKQIGEAETVGGASGSYTGTVSSGGSYTGQGNKSFLVDVLTEGAPGVATYRYSTDGGQTWKDNNGAGFATSSELAAVGDSTEGVQIAWSADGGSLTRGDRFRVDVFDPTLQQSRDALVKIDGIEVRSSSNTLTEALQGVTIELTATTAETPVTLAIEQDTNSVYEKVNGLLLSYNALVGFINGQSAYNAETKTAGTLSGDATIRNISSRFRSILGSTIPGISGDYATLAAVGIKADKNGVFSIDRAVFDKVLQEKPKAVEQLFVGTGESSGSSVHFASKSAKTASGTFALTITGEGDQRRLLLDGEPLTLQGTTASGAKGGRFEGLVLEVAQLDTLPEGFLGPLTLSSGVAEQIAKLGNELVDTTTGLIQGKTQAVQRSLKDINDQLTRQEDRLTTIEARLRKQYTSLEVTLGKLKAQGDYLTAQLSS